MCYCETPSGDKQDHKVCRRFLNLMFYKHKYSTLFSTKTLFLLLFLAPFTIAQPFELDSKSDSRRDYKLKGKLSSVHFVGTLSSPQNHVIIPSFSLVFFDNREGELP